MTKFHINPETGNPGLCSAKIQCRFGSESQHYSSADDARSAYELQHSSSFQTVSRNSVTPEHQARLDRIANEIRNEAASLADYMEEAEALPTVVVPNKSLGDDDGLYYVESLEVFRDPEFAMNRCQDVAFAIEEYTQNEGFVNGVLETIHIEVMGTYLNRHTANTYTDEEGRDWVVDYTYSQVDSTADFPYVGLKSEWEKSLYHAAENPDPKVREIYERAAAQN